MVVWERVYSGFPHNNSKWWIKEKKTVWELALSTRLSNSSVRANNMEGSVFVTEGFSLEC